MRMKRTLWLLGLVVLAGAAVLGADSTLDRIQGSVEEFTLDNGIKVIVMKRGAAPVVSFITHVDIGASNEVTGITGISHILEHMAFKGTTDVGTTDLTAEMKLLDELEEVFEALLAQRRRVTGPDAEEVARLRARMEELQKEAGRYVVNNEFVTILERHGGVNTNAGTSADSTVYMINLPSNKLELWAWLESERMLNPVIREYYQEIEVIREERRQRTESNPIGRLIEEVLAVAFKAHPYGQPVIGHMSDIESISRRDVERFHRQYYVGHNITVAVVGDVTAKEIRPLMKEYFERIPAGVKTGRVTTVEPLQLGEKRLLMPDASQPIVIMAFHKPDIRHPDSAVYDVIQDVLAGGESARMQQKMVKDERTALAVGAFPGFPGSKYPNLFLFFGLPNSGHTIEEIESGIWAELKRLQTEPVSDEELAAVITKAEARLYAQLQSNMGMAMQLAAQEVMTGDWRNLFRTVEDLRRVTKDDIQRVARECFTRRNLTFGAIVKPETEEPAAAAPPAQ